MYSLVPKILTLRPYRHGPGRLDSPGQTKAPHPRTETGHSLPHPVTRPLVVTNMVTMNHLYPFNTYKHPTRPRPPSTSWCPWPRRWRCTRASLWRDARCPPAQDVWWWLSSISVNDYLPGHPLGGVMEHVQGEVETEAENYGHYIAEAVISAKQQLVIPGWFSGWFFDGLNEMAHKFYFQSFKSFLNQLAKNI